MWPRDSPQTPQPFALESAPILRSFDGGMPDFGDAPTKVLDTRATTLWLCLIVSTLQGISSRLLLLALRC